MDRGLKFRDELMEKWFESIQSGLDADTSSLPPADDNKE